MISAEPLEVTLPLLRISFDRIRAINQKKKILSLVACSLNRKVI